LLDPIFEDFAGGNGFALSKNGKDWPERSLRADMPLASLIQVFRVDLNADAWKVWAVCSEDRFGEHFWKQALIADGVTGGLLSATLNSLLNEGLTRLVDWNARPEDLEFATKLGHLP
jgi:hypothetical protein